MQGAGHRSRLAGRWDTLGAVRTGNTLMVLGLGLVLLGALVRFVPGLFSWFGHLPGDVRVEGENSRLYVPLTSMVLVSVAVTLVLNLVAWFLRQR